ncbi:hypothetical protein PAMC26577_37455 [Caballeronia sordidicola]|uniref:Uncharacterized protein n=1 Tax=Caballeronia sordidicola TaxID=196367 RepID=A0A242M5V5_CABSO|nr:hypothetical protein PAMC26577_37455 [Caballeronia sordidicola]
MASDCFTQAESPVYPPGKSPDKTWCCNDRLNAPLLFL